MGDGSTLRAITLEDVFYILLLKEILSEKTNLLIINPTIAMTNKLILPAIIPELIPIKTDNIKVLNTIKIHTNPAEHRIIQLLDIQCIREPLSDFLLDSMGIEWYYFPFPTPLIFLKNRTLVNNSIFDFFDFKSPRSEIFVLRFGDIDGFLAFIPAFNGKNTIAKLDHIFLNIKPDAELLINIVAIDAIIATPC